MFRFRYTVIYTIGYFLLLISFGSFADLPNATNVILDIASSCGFLLIAISLKIKIKTFDIEFYERRSFKVLMIGSVALFVCCELIYFLVEMPIHIRVLVSFTGIAGIAAENIIIERRLKDKVY